MDCACLDGFVHLDPRQANQCFPEITLAWQLQLLDLLGCAKQEPFVLLVHFFLFPALQVCTVQLQSSQLCQVPVRLASTVRGLHTPKPHGWSSGEHLSSRPLLSCREFFSISTSPRLFVSCGSLLPHWQPRAHTLSLWKISGPGW